MSIIGIDLGTTNSLVAVWKDGKSELIPNAFGEFSTPSIVSVDENGSLYIGKTAKERLIPYPQYTVSVFKRFMGTEKQFTLGKKKYSAIELSSLILKKLKEDAEAYLGEKVTEAVVSVPAYFNNAQRDDTRRAGELAGLVVNRIINEPSAAALACQTLYPKDETLEMIFDFGGGTLDVSVVECFANVINVIAVSGDNHLGGYDFDMEIAKYFCDKNRIHFSELSESEKEYVLKNAENCKIALSNSDSADMILSLSEKTYSLIMDTEQIIKASAGIFKRIIKPIEDVISLSEVSWQEVERIVLVGGSCKMPCVRLFLQHYLKKEVLYIGSPDTIVAIGVGTYAGIMERSEDIRDTVLTDVCPFTLGVEIVGGVMSPLISRNTALPASKSGLYYTVKDNQSEIDFKIYQGEAPIAKNNLLLGKLTTPVPKSLAGQEVVEVRFTYDVNGILDIDTKVISTGRKNNLLILDKRNQMTEKQISDRLAELQSLKTHPRDKKENITLISRCEELYEQVSDDVRVFLMSEMQRFQQLLDEQDEIRIRSGRKRMEKVLSIANSSLSPLGLEEKLSDYNEDWFASALKESEETDDSDSLESYDEG